MTKVVDTPLEEVLRIHEYFGDPANAPMLQVASDKTLFVWQNMGAFEPTMQVLRDGPISKLDKQEDSSVGKLSFTVPGSAPTTVEDHFNANTMDAVLALKQGTVVYERYKTMRPFDKHNWFSTGKTIAGTLTALLAHDGKVDITKPVSQYVTELAGSAWDDVTVEATLDMATGLDSTEHDEQPVDDGRTNPERGWFKWAVSIGVFHSPDGSTATPFQVLRGMRRIKPAYKAYEYNSINTFVLERIINAVTGKDVPEVLGERAWRKMGAQNDAYIAVNKYGLANSWGMTDSVLRDLGRWGLLFSPSWRKVSSEQVVPDSVLESVQTGGHPDIFGKAATARSCRRCSRTSAGSLTGSSGTSCSPTATSPSSGSGARASTCRGRTTLWWSGSAPARRTTSTRPWSSAVPSHSTSRASGVTRGDLDADLMPGCIRAASKALGGRYHSIWWTLTGEQEA